MKYMVYVTQAQDFEIEVEANSFEEASVIASSIPEESWEPADFQYLPEK